MREEERMKRKTGHVRPADALKYLFLAAVCVLVLYPFLWVVISSFKLEKDIVTYPPTFFADGYTLENYKRILDYLPIFTYLKNTVIFAVGVGLCNILFDSMTGYAFARMQFRGKNLLFGLILVTMMVPFQIIMTPVYMEVFAFGLLDTYAGLILPKLTSAYGIYMMRSFFTSLPKELEEAARIDGMNEFGIYARIMLPLCSPALITLFIFNLMGCWNDLLYPLMLTSRTEMRTLSTGVAMFVGQYVVEYGPSLAIAMVSMLPLLFLYFFAQRYFVEGVAVTGMKD